MKRYKIVVPSEANTKCTCGINKGGSGCNCFLIRMDQSEDGEWVRHDDVKQYASDKITEVLLENADHIKSDSFFSKHYSKMLNDLQNLIGVLRSTECTCDENLEYRSKDYFKGRKSWICPAHGYKRL